MNEIKNIEPVHLLYYTKRTILLYERVFGRLPVLTDEAKTYLTTIQSQEKFAEVCTATQKALLTAVQSAAISEEDKAFLEELNYKSFMELYEEGDFELITEKHYRRKFFNEIPNDAMMQALIAAFKTIWNRPEEGPYFVEVYDICDEAVFFRSRKEMDDFLNSFDMTPYTAFEVRKGHSVEMYSE